MFCYCIEMKINGISCKHRKICGKYLIKWFKSNIRLYYVFDVQEIVDWTKIWIWNVLINQKILDVIGLTYFECVHGLIFNLTYEMFVQFIGRVVSMIYSSKKKTTSSNANPICSDSEYCRLSVSS